MCRRSCGGCGCSSRHAAFIAFTISLFAFSTRIHYLVGGAGIKEQKMRLVNPGLVGITRNLISSQGGNPLMINDLGELEPSGVMALLFNQAEVRTSLTPPIRFPIGPTGSAPDPSSNELIKSLQPTIILSGLGGRIEIAPYGVSQGGTSWWPVALAGAAGLAITWWLIFGQRR